MKQVELKLPEDLNKKLEGIASKYTSTPGEIVGDAIEKMSPWLAQKVVYQGFGGRHPSEKLKTLGNIWLGLPQD